MLKEKTILVGLTGSIAVYKSIDLIKGLSEKGASVFVIMTEAAKKFVSSLLVESATGCRVYDDMFADAFSHIELPKKADLFIVAPATANTINKFSCGIADNLLTTALITSKGQILLAPAMNWRMFSNSTLQKNLQYLKTQNVEIVGPREGALACGEEGIGRMAEPEEIIETVISLITEKDLKGEKILVTAGPTREYIDPVRFISNRSSGKMGYAIAKNASLRGAEVTLISGPVNLKRPINVNYLGVNSAEEMYKAVMDNIKEHSILIMASAVCDFKPKKVSYEKIDKAKGLTLELIQNVDILQQLSTLEFRPFIVGFSAETGWRLDRAYRKLQDKKMDMIVFNDVSKEGSGFDVDTNEVVIIDKLAERQLPLMYKDEVAKEILDRVLYLKKI
ncbi:MAG: bifunctional phosphopantothenoylcysteine decarboxylase/phosphopantothenate--cysteine ligase CoaBC [Thermodesulfovibrionales bacterium]|nr:bifunctional phosphopantothenoylcysteine decarboxylase/phosphopantothenate--cysteine ligase CoaBC [Thermodesulfovibrionales bacterium]